MDMTGLDQLPSGKWRARYRSGEGRQHSKTFETPEEAQAWRGENMPERPAPIDLILDPETGCLIWTGGVTSQGYGPHRRFWVRVKGSIPEELELDHLCQERRCVNVNHLEPVTHSENERRKRDWLKFTQQMKKFPS